MNRRIIPFISIVSSTPKELGVVDLILAFSKNIESCRTLFLRLCENLQAHVLETDIFKLPKMYVCLFHVRKEIRLSAFKMWLFQMFLHKFYRGEGKNSEKYTQAEVYLELCHIHSK